MTSTSLEPDTMMGIGAPDEVRPGPDGQLYQWVEGIDGLGNPVGFWKSLRRKVGKVVRRAVPLAQRFARMVPGPYGRLISTGLRTASPFLKQAGLTGVGELYEAPDGTMYQVHGPEDEEPLSGVADEDPQVMGAGTLGEVRQGADGNLYQWVEGVDGLGNPVGFWKAIKKVARKARPFLRRAMPLVQKYSAFVPGYGTAISAGLRTASPFLRKAGLTGVGELYEAPDGALYRVEGLEEDVEGLDAEENELREISDSEQEGMEGYVQPAAPPTRFPERTPDLFRAPW